MLPPGRMFEGSAGSYIAYGDRSRSTGVLQASYQIWMPDRSGLGLDRTARMMHYKVAPPMPPARALAWLSAEDGVATDLRVLGADRTEDLDPGLTRQLRQIAMRSGAQLASQLLHVEFTLRATGQRCRGIYLVNCLYPSLGSVWSLWLSGSWAPADRFERMLPVFLAMADGYRLDQGWAQGHMQQQQVRLQASGARMRASIHGLQRQYERNNAAWAERQRSQDDLSRMRSQTTLGQGIWIAGREGGEIVQTDPWGARDQNGNVAEGRPWSTTSFRGRSPFTGQQLEEVDSRELWERYQRMGR